MVRRPGVEAEETSLLRLSSLHPKDSIEVRVGDKLTKDWTLVTAYLAAGQKVKVQSWNLWDKQWRTRPILAGTIPSGDVVPLFFLVLNRDRDRRVGAAIQKALDLSSEQIVSASAVFESTYSQQSRLLKFITAYASLGPASENDPGVLHTRLAMLNADLGYNVDPNAPVSTPGDLQRGLDAGMGIINQLRNNPDDPTPLAPVLQHELPTAVADWLGLASDLVHVLIRPKADLKVSFIPASAAEMDPTQAPDENWMDLVTERVPEAKPNSVSALVFHPLYDKLATSKPIPLKYSRTDITAFSKEVTVPLAPESRDLFIRPLAWNWEVSFDKHDFTPLSGAKLLPGRGLVFPIDDAWWGGQAERDVLIRTHIGSETTPAIPVRIAKVFPQQWALEPGTQTDLAVGDGAGRLVLARSGGTAQPFYNISSVKLIDATGRPIDASGMSFNGSLTAAFDLSHVNPGWASISIQQDEAVSPDPPVKIFIAPKRPNISIACATGDKVIRIGGPDAAMVAGVSSPALSVVKQDSSEPGTKNFLLAGPVPSNVTVLDVTYRDPAQPSLEWHRTEPVSFGLPRPKMSISLIGTLPDQIPVGFGVDATWAMATMPPGWFRAKQPIKISLDSIAPFQWSHDVSIDLGFGPSIDVQKAVSLTEGPVLSIDATSPSALATLNLETVLPTHDVKRNSGLLWFRATRGDLASPWTLATLPGSEGVPLRAVKLPTVQSIDTTNPARVRITFANADQILGVRFPGQAATVVPQLVEANPTGLVAFVDAPPGTTDLDLELQEAPDGMIHIKIVHPPTP
jgi:hypothetical protein